MNEEKLREIEARLEDVEVDDGKLCQWESDTRVLIAEVRRMRRQYEPGEGDPGIHVRHLTREETSGDVIPPEVKQ